MIRYFPREEWKKIKIQHKLRFNYAISNYGRVMAFTESFKDGRLLKGGDVMGYKAFHYRIYGGKKVIDKMFYIHRLVAQYFLPEKEADQGFVIHLDYNRGNNYVQNLRWASQKELTAHHQKNPSVIAAKEKRRRDNVTPGHKLTPTQVKHIKKKLFNPNRKTRMKMIAKQFNISEMQLYRIKTGENWGHISPD